MYRKLLTAASLVATLIAAPMAASAHPIETAQQAEPSAVEFAAEDYAFALLLGDVGMAAGVFGGGALGVALAGSCEESGSGFGGSCMGRAATAGMLGAAVAGPLLSASAIYGYGELTGHNGSFLATLAGTSAGSLGAFVLGAAADESAVALVALLVLPTVGGTLGYGMTHEGPDEPTSGALVDLSKTGGARLSVPAVGVTQPARGEVQLSVTVLGGSW